MKKTSYFLPLIILFFYSCKSLVVEKVANEMITVNDLKKQNSYTFLNESLKNKEIVLLGEATHGDGDTFEIKSNLVEFLVKEKGYDTFAFEARDFFEIEYLNGNPSLQNFMHESFKYNWVRKWSPWGPSKQIQPLVDLFANNKLNYVGLEPFYLDSYQSQQSFLYLQNSFEKLNLKSYSTKIWEVLSATRERLIASNEGVSEEEFDAYIKALEYLYEEISNIAYEENLFLLQTIENTITATKIHKFKSPITDDDELNIFTNLRDAQMAKNLIWFKKRYPKAKIVGWMANFHAANKLKDVEYADEDVYRYSKFTVFGEHIKKEYGNLVFSLAFTSSRGVSKMPYNMETIEEVIIKAPKNCLEERLDKKNISYGYINFDKINRQNPKLKENKFNSIMLGYTNQYGKWLNVFDGLIYIRENSKAISIY
ncbi:hypothetical protein GOQ30_06200 [Flavobacterium sp. TP390]|uniref:Erythromycin esterase n=1 Tax=Flavobacterium profundi TaxID=1774945 RepID=A0A6I4IGQ5_9FLAO|nr:erythromycin esterase family protein [Flavobacterium profundi]MVO08754.1 hypothetical protein [Flavobacterium profundi]